MDANKRLVKAKVEKEVKEMLMPVRVAVMVLNADGSGDGDILIHAMLDELQTMKYKKSHNATSGQQAEENSKCGQTGVDMDFGAAIRAVKKGHRIARKGWNGKSQYVELATRVSYIDTNGSLVNVDHAAAGNAALAFVGTSGVQLGWLASQADMLAEDWYIVEPAKEEAE